MSFPKIRITDEGKVFVAKALAGTGDSIKFTKFKVGSGIADTDETLWDAYTDLIETKLSVNITDYDRDDDIITLTGEFSNGSVATAFFWTELGIYGVQVDSSNNEGAEKLLFYGNAGSLAEYVPASDAEVAVRHRWSTQLTISSAADVSAVVHSITYATSADLNAHINDESNPHRVSYDQTGAPPKSHTSANAEYGSASGSLFGHVRLSDAVDSIAGASSGIAATPAAVKAVYDKADQNESDISDCLTALSSRNLRTERGSYTGSGGTGTNKQLVFYRDIPSIVFIAAKNWTGQLGILLPRQGYGFSLYNGNMWTLDVRTLGSNTVLWFSIEDNPAYRLDSAGQTYIYCGIM